MSFSHFIYHIVFSTKNRYPTITTLYERIMYKILYRLITNEGGHVYRIGGMPDHVHLLIDMPATLSPAKFIQKIKQESSYIAKDMKEFPQWDGWEKGYGAFTYSYGEIDAIKHYIINQKEHHKKVSFRDEYREWLLENGISPDAPYFPQ